MHNFVDPTQGVVGSISGSVKAALPSTTGPVETGFSSSPCFVQQNSPSTPLSLIVQVKSEQMTTEHDIKLLKVFGKLSVSSIDISEANQRTLVSLISKYFDAFAATLNDVCRTHVIRHRIDICDVSPFKDGFSYYRQAWRAFCDHKI